MADTKMVRINWQADEEYPVLSIMAIEGRDQTELRKFRPDHYTMAEVPANILSNFQAAEKAYDDAASALREAIEEYEEQKQKQEAK